MRNFLLVCVVALVVSVGVEYAVGFVDLAREHGTGKYRDDSLAEFKGKVTAVRPEKRELVMAAPVQDRAFELAKNASITINGRDAKLEEVQPGDQATVTFQPDGRKLIATAVRCTRKGID